MRLSALCHSPPGPLGWITVPPCQTSGTRSPSPSCSLRSPFALRSVRPLLAWCGLHRLDACFGGVSSGLFTFSCWLNVRNWPLTQQQLVFYLAGQSSAHRARPGECVSYVEVMVGPGRPYVEQRLDSRGVLSGLVTCQFYALVQVDISAVPSWSTGSVGGGVR
jgi:hypothetical protein